MTMKHAAYDTIYLSPHLDDVALSCGGQVSMLTGANRPVLIVTVMAGDPPAPDSSEFVRLLHDRWGLQQDVVANRRAEDTLACQILGAEPLYWYVPDCIYRTERQSAEPLYQSEADLFGAVHGSESQLVKDIAQQIRQLPPHDHLLVPLGVGNHVDHQITRLAAEASALENLTYYEEYPYVAVPGALASLVGSEGPVWQPTIIPLTEEALRAKVHAIAAFRSQISSFFRDREHMEKTIREQAQSAGGERLWLRIKKP